MPILILFQLALCLLLVCQAEGRLRQALKSESRGLDHIKEPGSKHTRGRLNHFYISFNILNRNTAGKILPWMTLFCSTSKEHLSSGGQLRFKQYTTQRTSHSHHLQMTLDFQQCPLCHLPVPHPPSGWPKLCRMVTWQKLISSLHKSRQAGPCEICLC